jgi:hypothetical protein
MNTRSSLQCLKRKNESGILIGYYINSELFSPTCIVFSKKERN